MFHVIKSSRVYCNRGYCGIASNFVLQEFELLDDAIDAVHRLLIHNPVGWVIYDSKTKQQVDFEKKDTEK